MADGEGLGRMPGALRQRHVDVPLPEGKTIRVHKWSWQKVKVLLPFVGSPSKAFEIAADSVAQEDRARVEAMDPEDLMLIATAAIKLNVTEELSKNYVGLLQVSNGLLEAVEKNAKETAAP